MILTFADPDAVAGAAASIKGIALYGTVMVGATLSLLWKQEIGLYLLTVLLPLQTTRYHLHAFPLGANIVDILLFCSIVGAFLRPSPRLKYRPGVLIFLVVLSIFYYLSLWRGAFFLDSRLPLWFNDVRLVDYKNFLVMPLLAVTATLILRERRQIATILVLSAVTAVAVDYSYFKSSAGRDFGHYAEETRDSGPLGYAGENGLASYMAEITAFLLAFLAIKRRPLLIFALLLALAANICCILFSYSREAYLALAFSLCFIALLRVRWLLVPLALLGFAWQTVLPTAVQERMAMTYSHSSAGETPQLDASAQERVDLWTDAMAMFHQNPVIGTGFLTYSYMHRVGAYRDTHNFYLKMLVETGLTGLVLFVIQIVLFFRSGYVLFRKADDPFLSLFGLGFAALVLSAAVVNLFGDRWLFIQVDSNLWIFLGCVLAASAAPIAGRIPDSLPTGDEGRRRLADGDIFRPVIVQSSGEAPVEQCV